MTGEFLLGEFLHRFGRDTQHDLSTSGSATLSLASLLELAGPDDLLRWQTVGLGYADPRGAAWLRMAIANQYWGLTADDVQCSAGAQEALICLMGALLGPGDHAIVVVPIYQPSEHSVTSICAATGIPLKDDGSWRLDVARIASAIRPHTKLVLMNFPNSPTGAVMEPEALASLVELCRYHNLWLVNDEVYRLTETVPLLSMPRIADIYERGVSVNAISKGLGLPGLRTGWVVSHDRQLLARVLLEKSMLSSCVAAPCEVLAHIALQAQHRIVGRNRRLGAANLRRLEELLSRFPDLFSDIKSGSLAFAFPRFLGAEGATRFAEKLARDAGVLLLPSELWRTPLAEVPTDRLRVGLGHLDMNPALIALEEHLYSRRRTSVWGGTGERMSRKL